MTEEEPEITDTRADAVTADTALETAEEPSDEATADAASSLDAERGAPEERAAAHRVLRWTRALLVVLLVGVIAAVVLVVRVRAADQATADRNQVQEAARTVADQMVTLDAQNARRHVEVMLGLSTDPFRQQLTQLAATFEAILRQGQVAAQGTVDTIGVQSIGNGEAKVLATATTTVRNTQVPNGAARDFRLVIGLRDVDGDWRVSSVDVAR